MTFKAIMRHACLRTSFQRLRNSCSVWNSAVSPFWLLTSTSHLWNTIYTDWMHGIMQSSQNSKHSKSHQAVTLTTNIMYYWIVILQKTITFFPKSLFLLRIPSNINQSTVGLFWLSNNKQIQAIYKIKVHWKYVFVNILLSILVHIFFYIIIFFTSFAWNMVPINIRNSICTYCMYFQEIQMWRYAYNYVDVYFKCSYCWDV